MSRGRRGSRSSLDLYFKSIRHVKVLGAREEKELIRKAQDGDREAFKKIIVANQKLVVKEALKYYFKNNNFLDLVNEGNKGLIEALRRFDISRKNRFYTYALWWVRSEIRRYLSKNHRIISFPDIFYNDYLSFKKEYYKIRKRLGRRPTEKELAKMLNLTEKKIKTLLSVPTDIISLDVKLSREENAADLSSILPDESMEDPQAALIGVSTRDLIVKDIGELSEREARVIRMRYGFKDQRPMRLREIAKEMNMSPEGIRRIEMKALKKLKNKLNKQGVYGVLN